jgi:hypothetical protein
MHSHDPIDMRVVLQLNLRVSLQINNSISRLVHNSMHPRFSNDFYITHASNVIYSFSLISFPHQMSRIPIVPIEKSDETSAFNVNWYF